MKYLKRVTCWMFGHYWCFTVKYAGRPGFYDCCGICEATKPRRSP